MEPKAKSIRPFIGAKEFDLSRSFYQDFGFEEVVLNQNMSLFKTDAIAFYLQRAFVKDWIDNLMIFIEVDNVDEYWEELSNLNLTAKYKTVKITPSKLMIGAKNVLYTIRPGCFGISDNFLNRNCDQ